MRRDPRLNPLSWEHQRTLALAQRVCKTLDNPSAPPEPLSAEIDSFWRQEIERHFRAEETILFPPAQGLSVCRGEIEKVLKEHRRLRELASLIGRVQALRQADAGAERTALVRALFSANTPPVASAACSPAWCMTR